MTGRNLGYRASMDQSDLHGRRVDDELERESGSLTHGAPVEARAEEDRFEQDAADDELHLSGAVVTAGDRSPAPQTDAPSLDEARARSELARHLRPSVFPASPAMLVDCAREEHAPDDLVARLTDLPQANYDNVAQVWQALGGHREHRPHGDTAAHGPTSGAAPTIEAPPASEPTPLRPPQAGAQRFGFRVDPWYRWAALPFGIRADNAYVEIDPTIEPAQLAVRFGPWCIVTTLANVAAATTTGPYALLKTIGPARLSLADTGVTFATNRERGVCISFRHAVVGLDPLHLVHHQGVTVTVEDPDALVEALTRH